MPSQDIVDTGRGPSPLPGTAIEKFTRIECPHCGGRNTSVVEDSDFVNRSWFCINCANAWKSEPVYASKPCTGKTLTFAIKKRKDY